MTPLFSTVHKNRAWWYMLFRLDTSHNSDGVGCFRVASSSSSCLHQSTKDSSSRHSITYIVSRRWRRDVVVCCCCRGCHTRCVTSSVTYLLSFISWKSNFSNERWVFDATRWWWEDVILCLCFLVLMIARGEQKTAFCARLLLFSTTSLFCWILPAWSTQTQDNNTP